MRVRIKKTVSSALCAAALLCALCAPASAAIDPYYSGELDSATGEALTGSLASASSTRVRISEGMWYDRDMRVFVYPVGSGEVRSNVADGMVVTDPVNVTPDVGVEVTVYRNGTELTGADLTQLGEAGSYTVSAKSTDSVSNLFEFTVVGQTSNLAGGYVMPEGFYILSATLDGEEAYYDRNFIGMEDEGEYEIEYVCPDTAAHYTLRTTIDRTPPQLTLDGKLDKDGRFRSAVQVGGLEAGDSVTLTRDGDAMRFPADGKLTGAGVYQMEAFDAAGNAAQSQFTILVYLDLNSLLFLALVCVSLAGVLGYVLYQRKKLKFF